MELDEVAVAHTELGRFLAFIEIAVQQEAVAVIRRQQSLHHAIVIEHIAVHQDHVAAAHQRLADTPQGDDAALLVLRVVDQFDAIAEAEGGDLGLDQVRAESHGDDDFVDPAGAQDLKMPLQQGFAAEREHHLGQTLPLEGHAEPLAGRQDDCSHR